MFLTSRGEETGSRPWSNESRRGIPAGTWNSKSADAAAASTITLRYVAVVDMSTAPACCAKARITSTIIDRISALCWASRPSFDHIASILWRFFAACSSRAFSSSGPSFGTDR